MVSIENDMSGVRYHLVDPDRSDEFEMQEKFEWASRKLMMRSSRCSLTFDSSCCCGQLPQGECRESVRIRGTGGIRVGCP